MIFDCIEKNVVRRVRLLNTLYCKRAATLEKLSFMLECAPMTVICDVEFLKKDLKVPVSQNEAGEYILDPNKKSLEYYLHKLYATSTFLTFLQYFLVYEDKIEFIQFIKKQKVSTAKGYRMRQELTKCIDDIGLELKGNSINGNQILLRFLRAELVANLDMNIIPVNEQINQYCDQILDELEDRLNITFFDKQRQLYKLLMNQTVLSSEWKLHYFIPEIELLISAKLYPIGYPELVNKYFSKVWARDTKLFEEKFAIIAFLAINSYVFDENLPEQMILQNELSFLTLPMVKELIDEFKQQFIIEKERQRQFYTALYLFVRDALLGIQEVVGSCKFSDETPDTLTNIYCDLQTILSDEMYTQLPISDYHKITLYKRLSIILKSKHYDNVIIASQNRSDMLFLRDYLHSLYSTRITGIKAVSSVRELSASKKMKGKNLFVIDKEWCNKALVSLDDAVYVDFPLSNKQIFEIFEKLSR